MDKKLLVCEFCLRGIESREGKQSVIVHEVEAEGIDSKCMWCEEEGFEELYEITK